MYETVLCPSFALHSLSSRKTGIKAEPHKFLSRFTALEEWTNINCTLMKILWHTIEPAKTPRASPRTCWTTSRETWMSLANVCPDFATRETDSNYCSLLLSFRSNKSWWRVTTLNLNKENISINVAKKANFSPQLAKWWCFAAFSLREELLICCMSREEQ